MDISPIYELRERLRAAAIAGTSLLSQDFRLKRAIEGIAPLENASPVFAKISLLAKSLIAPDCANVPGTLLDTITLTDAVICTLGTSEVAEPLEPLNITDCGTAVVNAPYSLLNSLLDALTTSGSGHYNTVLDIHNMHPELFSDYRVKPALVKGLGASYSELADLIESWLMEEDETLLPFLMKDFVPDGKKEMVRRVHVIEHIAGKNANDFYLEQLENSQKEVRQALIFALRHEPSNVDKLIELAKTEKGSNKKIACHVLGFFNDKKADEFFRNIFKKKPSEALSYLLYTTSDWSCELAAELFIDVLKPLTGPYEEVKDIQLTNENAEIIAHCLASMLGKHGAKVNEAFKMAASIGTLLDKPLKDETTVWIPETPARSFSSRAFSPNTTFSRLVSDILFDSIMVNPEEGLKNTALEIYEDCKQETLRLDYFKAAFLVKLLSDKDCTSWLDVQIKSFKDIDKKHICNTLINVLINIEPLEDGETFVIGRRYTDLIVSSTSKYSSILKQPLKGSLTDYLLEYADRQMSFEVFHKWICPNDKEYCLKLAKHFRKCAFIYAKDCDNYMNYIKKCGVTDASLSCAGIPAKRFNQEGQASYWEIMSCIDAMPDTNEVKAAELENICSLIKDGKIKSRYGTLNVQQFETIIEELKNAKTQYTI